MSDPCSCECQLESWGRDLINYGFNTGAAPWEQWGFMAIASSDADSYARGTPVGEFNSARPGAFVWHTDWCSHRPTKASISCTSFGHANGTVRVFVEAKSDYSAYVFAEIEVEADVAFPTFAEKHHLYEGVPVRAAGYVAYYFIGVGTATQFAVASPLFGVPGTGFVYTPRDAEDDDDYTTSPWPLLSCVGQGIYGNLAPYVSDDAYSGTRQIVRCGYRFGGSDNVTAEFMLPHSVHSFSRYADVGMRGAFGILTVGCHWNDIEADGNDGKVRCGLELSPQDVLWQGVSGFSGLFFTYPFEVPRSLFTEGAGAASAERYIGASATSSTKTVVTALTGDGLGYVTGDSVFVDAAGIGAAVTCAADYANIIVDPLETADVSTVPAAGQRDVDDPGAEVTSASAYFVRRPDLISRVGNTVAAADSWHASHLIRKGSPLAARNALHDLHLEFVADETEWPELAAFGVLRGGTLMPLYQMWGGTGFQYGTSTILVPQRPTLHLYLPSDEFIANTTSDSPLPPMWAWNGFSGAHTLTPFIGDRRLVPNAYHVFHDSTWASETTEIVPPEEGEIEGGRWADGSLRGLDVGPFTDAQWAASEGVECPHSAKDYRVEWGIETFPQIWATTQIFDDGQWTGPLGVPIDDSGMIPEQHDRWRQAGAVWPTMRCAAGGINVRVRLGTKITVTRVKGFRRVREKYGNATNPPANTAWLYRGTGDVRVAGDHECSDVACNEHICDFSIPLDHADLLALSAGDEITKTLPVGYFPIIDPYTDEEIGQTPWNRTVKVRVDTHT